MKPNAILSKRNLSLKSKIFFYYKIYLQQQKEKIIVNSMHSLLCLEFKNVYRKLYSALEIDEKLRDSKFY